MKNEEEISLLTSNETKDREVTREPFHQPATREGIKYFQRHTFEDCNISEATNTDFKHALLNRANGKAAKFSNFDFRYAELTDCYFHGATFEKCDFTGAKVRRCNFRTASFQDCTFDYFTIEDTPLDYKQVVKNLPDRPNVAQEILHALRRNAVTLGEQKAVRYLTLLEVDQEREHLRRAFNGQGGYYRNKYGTVLAKINLKARSFGLWTSAVLWGHGEKVSRLIFSSLICILALSSISVLLDVLRGRDLSAIDAGSQLLSYLRFNLLDLVGATPKNSSGQSTWVGAAVAVSRVVFGGMFVTYLFRSVSRR